MKRVLVISAGLVIFAVLCLKEWMGHTSGEKVPWYAHGGPNEELTAEQIHVNASYAQFVTMANEVLPRLEKVCEDFHVPWRGGNRFEPTNGDISYTTYDTPKVDLTSKEHRFTFQKLTNHLAVYIARGRGSDVEPEVHPSKPKWSVDEAIALGVALRDVFVSDRSIVFGKPVAQYTPPSGGKSQGIDYHDAGWFIAFPRITDKGIPFDSDGLRIRLSENGGIISIDAHLDSTYVEEPGTPLTEAQAVAIAKKSRPSLCTNSNDIIDYKLKSAELAIVSPEFEYWRAGRLSWIIWLQPVRTGGSGMMYDDSQEVIVDAMTGKIIANNAMAYFGNFPQIALKVGRKMERRLDLSYMDFSMTHA